MKIKLSKKQKEEVATKGFVFDILDETLNERDYVTKSYFDKKLDEKLSDYVTKDYMHHFLMNEFKPQLEDELTKKLEVIINNSFKTHIDALMEDNHATIITLIESFENRFERIEKHVGLLAT